jgi:hypothetical protein
MPLQSHTTLISYLILLRLSSALLQPEKIIINKYVHSISKFIFIFISAGTDADDDMPDMELDSAPASDVDQDTDPDSDEEEGGDEAQEFMEEIENAMPDTISHVRCGVHTLQLAIQDGLKHPLAAGMIGKIRNLAVELRTPKLAEKVKKAGHRMAVLDQETR